MGDQSAEPYGAEPETFDTKAEASRQLGTDAGDRLEQSG